MLKTTTVNGFVNCFLPLDFIILGNICIANCIRQPQKKLPAPSYNQDLAVAVTPLTDVLRFVSCKV